ncbi:MULTISPECIES: sensor domain-containing diguanylate cyclase [unclassified Pseudomonas]|uniref:sensor domain-containing diguanylate cyclase n=1 Tax=unclassified Pseudomonas TaxID=196821 RepID=UPI000BC9C402|nr:MULTISPECIES: sensor domain-containing diguanylate cyclase [unclassified Pseudomonas]PVZ19527.1 PAS domain S-box-containing protein/diguanylate cyclase (GGDEF)-like protein [Pseudomonas sp. URIL14HWK12:I12]PVZ22888.1 PAS domain S-box-containing protein/diguanylate cyclase (GGDEF)-like protein [Pseudomonas sp. URIL14HWK12:I10]PVZ37482.1 PAS domain S-box-containing protein/diguanylate cyclase (GGDEF)-like protein [Pseudomonas sp. URIL14HWK12:I11]SNZ14895.1 PAS domain S-box-containing protein/d
MPAVALLDDPAALDRLLKATGAIAWRLDWQTLTFTYMGSQIETLLGWPLASWVGINDWVERMHPADRDQVVNFCISQSRAGIDHEAEYRALTVHGHCVWLRDVVHVVKGANSEVDSLVGFMFDISDRKKNEEELTRLHRQLEEFSYQDGLTGIANRRMFDSVLEREWSNAQRSGQPLALLLIDIDHFNSYNEHYGHLQGDECLRQLARTLSGAANRPRDFFARLGGEEFAWILPETHLEAARAIGERCLQLMRQHPIPHAASPQGQPLSLSLGAGVTVPARRDFAAGFVDQVDALLFQAKRAGRRRGEYKDFRA